jgi:hypothetical protein
MKTKRIEQVHSVGKMYSAVNVKNLRILYPAAYLLKARTVETEKPQLLVNGFVTRNNGVAVGNGVSCAVRAGAI